MRLILWTPAEGSHLPLEPFFLSLDSIRPLLVQIVTFLIDRGADVDRKNHDGLTALDLAKDDDMEELLLTLKVPPFPLFLTVLRLLPRPAALPCAPRCPSQRLWACGRMFRLAALTTLPPRQHICICIPSCTLHTMPPSSFFTPCVSSFVCSASCMQTHKTGGDRHPDAIIRTDMDAARCFRGHVSLASRHSVQIDTFLLAIYTRT